MQWLHLTAAVIGLGCLAFMALILMPSADVLDTEQRNLLSRVIRGRFRWTTWSAILVLIGSGIFNIRRFYWEAPWDRGWELLTLKVALSFAMFGIILGLTIPLKLLDPMRQRQRGWLLVALGLGLAVVLISAYLRRV